jgi:hypothetical protein
MSTPPICGAQQPTPIPGPFDWTVFTAIATAAGFIGGAYALAQAIPGILSALGVGATTFTAAAAGAGAIVALVVYYALKPDGCIRSTPKGEPICLSGIVQDTTDLSNTVVDVLAPFAMGPSGVFDVVVKSMYWHYVTQNSFWVFCDDKAAAMLRCLIKSKTACGGKVGSLVGVGLGAIGGMILGCLAAAAVAGALGCTASGPFYLLCLLLVLLVAAVVAAVVAFVGAMIGGWVGEGIASTGGDPVGDAWKGLTPGAIVTVKGNWATDPDIGNNELFYTTNINRTGQFSTGPSYTTADADSTAPDDCPLVPPPPN